LDGEADPVVGAAHRADEFKIHRVEVEVAGELLLARVADVAAVARPLLVGQEAARHDVRNSQVSQGLDAGPKTKGLPFAKLLCESLGFCDKFRTVAGSRP
jgi:hypothetical protein